MWQAGVRRTGLGVSWYGPIPTVVGSVGAGQPQGLDVLDLTRPGDHLRGWERSHRLEEAG